MSERTREKLVHMGKTLRVHLPSRVHSAALTKTTHVHLVGHNETAGPKLYEVEIVPAFHPSIAIEFESHSLLERFHQELQNSAFSFDYDRVSHVVADKFKAGAHETIYTLGSGPVNERRAIFESLKRFFINKGYVPNSDVVFRDENRVRTTYVVASYKQGPTFMRKMGAVPGGHQDQLVPATFAETCYICRPDKQRAKRENQACLQVDTQSRQEPDFRPTGLPKVNLPRRELTPLVFRSQSDSISQPKRKASACATVTLAMLTFVIARG